jgi:hypothetical protein
MVLKTFERGEQALLVPARVTLRAKERGALVVVHAVNHETLRGKKRADFRANQTGRAGDKKGFSHFLCFYSNLGHNSTAIYRKLLNGDQTYMIRGTGWKIFMRLRPPLWISNFCAPQRL